MTKTADAIVVGLGAVGSATAWQLARRGLTVVGIDRWAPPHEHGSSHGETRITRCATGEGEPYVALALRSQEIWREIEAATGEELFGQKGVLVMNGPAAAHPKKPGFMEETIGLARRFGIAHEVLATDELRARFPQFVPADGTTGFFEPGAGILNPERCIATQLRLAGEGGATIRTGERVGRVEEIPDGVRVTTDRDVYEAGTVFVTAGGWNPELVPGLPVRTVLHRQVITWFAVDDEAAFGPDRFPAFIWMHGGEGGISYGFPMVFGAAGLKIASEHFVAGPGSPDAIDRTIDPAEITAVYDDHVRGKIRGVTSRLVKSRTCFYTQEPTSRFVIERHPDAPAIVVVAACSGHGFKHSAALGESLAAGLVGEEPRAGLSAFSPER